LKREERIWYARNLIDTAMIDFEASRILLESKLYPQAVFHFQQAIEKAIKAILVYLDLVEDVVDLKREIGHRIVEKSYRYVISDVKNLYACLIEHCGKTVDEKLEETMEINEVLLKLEFSTGYWTGILLTLPEWISELMSIEDFLHKRAIEEGEGSSTNILSANLSGKEWLEEMHRQSVLLGNQILNNDNTVKGIQSLIGNMLEVYTENLCKLLAPLSERAKEKLDESLAIIASSITHGQLLSDKFMVFCELPQWCRHKCLHFLDEEAIVRHYLLADYLAFLLMYYVIYEPFVSCARYPCGRCSPLDIKEGAFIVEWTKQLIHYFKEIELLNCIKELIEGQCSIKRCCELMEIGRSLLSCQHLNRDHS